MYDRHEITARQLESGYWHIRGQGPCNWAQPPSWPCDEDVLRAHSFGEACEDFIQSALAAALEEARRLVHEGVPLSDLPATPLSTTGYLVTLGSSAAIAASQEGES